MQLPLDLNVYLVSCNPTQAEALETLLNGLREAPLATVPAFEALSVSRHDDLHADMHGHAVIIMGDEHIGDAEAFLGDTTILSLGSSVPADELVRKGFFDALPADASPERLSVSVINLARQSLLRRRLVLRENVLQTYLDISDNMLWTKDLRDYHMDVNHYLTFLTGKPLDQIEGLHEIEVYGLDPSDPGCGESDRLVRKTARQYNFEESMPDANGVQHHLHVVKAPWLDGQGRVVGTIGLGKDVTELLNEQTKFDSFLNSIELAVAIVDPNDRLVQANVTFLALVGQDEVAGKPFVEVASTALKPVKSTLASTRSDETATHSVFLKGDYKVVTDDGQTFIWNLDRFFLKDYWGNHTGFTYIFQDVTDERNQRQEISSLAKTDALTGAYNRTGLYELYESVEKGTRLTFMFLDIDDFKKINDTCGHAVGDCYLADVANILRYVFPQAHIVRYGGDEFFVALSASISRPEIESEATRLIEYARELSQSPDLCVEAGSFSIGILYNFPIYGNLDAAIQHCDHAMYEAKRTGKNRYNLVDASNMVE